MGNISHVYLKIVCFGLIVFTFHLLSAIIIHKIKTYIKLPFKHQFAPPFD